MALTQSEVDGFLAAPKAVSRHSDMRWVSTGGSIDQYRWRGRVEEGGVTKGILLLVVNRAVPRSWNFDLQLRGEEVYAWHFKTPINHRNKGCPAGFPARVKVPHEHLWLEGSGYQCARPLDDMATWSHHQVLDSFCQQSNIAFQPMYMDPGAGEQLVMVDPEEDE